jgi:hypothetical protein
LGRSEKIVIENLLFSNISIWEEVNSWREIILVEILWCEVNVVFAKKEAHC